MSEERSPVAFDVLTQQGWEARVVFWFSDYNCHLFVSSRLKTPVLKALTSLQWPNMAYCQAFKTQKETPSLEVNRNPLLPCAPTHSRHSLLIVGVIFAYQTHMESQSSVLQEWSWLLGGNHSCTEVFISHRNGNWSTDSALAHSISDLSVAHGPVSSAR